MSNLRLDLKNGREPRGVGRDRRRVLLAADEAVRRALTPAMAALRPTWDVTEADSFEQARFVLQMERCDVLLLDASLYRPRDAGGVAWLAEVQREPVVFLADERAHLALDAVRCGANYWMPRNLAASHPALLETLLGQALELAALQGRLREADDEVQAGRRHVDRLLGLLWDVAPTEGRAPWFTQRHMMERLQEELARSHRRGGPLAVALGEMHGPAIGPETAGWAAEQVLRLKRRCDVAGQYGPYGFMLLLPRSRDREAVGCCRRLKAELERGLAGARASFGVANYSPAAPSAQALLRRAEERLEQARATSTGRVVFF
jgi:GGDEF domain-containing protein